MIAAGVRSDRVNLVGGDVELVAAAVLEEQVVTFGATEGALDQAPVARDAVNVVDDVCARCEVVEEALAGSLPRPSDAVRPAPSRDVRLGEDCELRVGKDGALLELGDRDVDAGATKLDAEVSLPPWWLRLLSVAGIERGAAGASRGSTAGSGSGSTRSALNPCSSRTALIRRADPMPSAAITTR